MLKRYIGYLITIVVVALIILIVTLNSGNIDNLPNTFTSDNVKDVTKYTHGKKHYSSFEIKGTQLIIKVGENDVVELVKSFENDSAIFFSVIDKLQLVTYSYYDRMYNYQYEDLNAIFNYKLHSKKLFEINRYYDSLIKTKLYLGNINGIYNIYDGSGVCNGTYLELYKTSDYIYKMRCSDITKVIIVDKNSNTFNIVDALNRGLVTGDDLIKYNLDVTKEAR